MITTANVNPPYWGEITGMDSTSLPQEYPVTWSKVHDRLDYPQSRSWLNIGLPIGDERSTSQMTDIVLLWFNLSGKEASFRPRTELGKRLFEIRKRAIAAGIPLLNEDEVLEEVRYRRGEFDNGEANLR